MGTPSPTPGNAGDWQAWPGVGVTWHDDHSYEVDTYCAANHDMIHMCWDMDDAWVREKQPCDASCQQAKAFHEGSVMSKFCSRGGLITFGHPVNNLCGECIELRVQRIDGNFNTVTVMTVDNPRSGWAGASGDTSSPELSKVAKIALTEEVVLPSGRMAELNDRLPFEYRSVPCV